MTKYLFEQAELSCEVLETEAGLAKGSITSMTVHPSGAVEIETKTAITQTVQDKIKTSLEKRGLAKGNKND